MQFNSIHWNSFQLGERTLLIKSVQTIQVDQIQDSVSLIKELLGNELHDIVPAYDSIAIFTDMDSEMLLKKLAASMASKATKREKVSPKEVAICYELGPDLHDVASHVGLEPDELIQRHLSGTYTAALIGFTPGFIYLEGLDGALSCPRKATPRKKLDGGSVAIGGGQTGIYGLASPGGWNVIGRTPLQLFDKAQQPPMDIQVGQQVRFKRVSKSEFDSWES